MAPKHTIIQSAIDIRGFSGTMVDSLYFPDPQLPSDKGKRRLMDGTPTILISAADAPRMVAGNIALQTSDAAYLGIYALTVSDALRLMLQDGELFTLAAQLRAGTPWPYILLVGQLEQHGVYCTIDGQDSRIHWRAIMGALATIQEIGVTVPPFFPPADLGATLFWLAQRDRTPKRVSPIREAVFPSIAEQIFTSIPGIGPAKYDELMIYFGTPAFAISAMTDFHHHPTIKGIPNSARLALVDALQLERGQFMGLDYEKDLPTNEQPIEPEHPARTAGAAA